jgi:hypothetical protein
MANEAIALLIEMIAECVAPNSMTVLCLLVAIADDKNLVRGRWIYGFAIRHGFLQMLTLQTKLYECISVVERLQQQGLYLQLVSWTVLMMGCLYCGHGGETIQL